MPYQTRFFITLFVLLLQACQQTPLIYQVEKPVERSTLFADHYFTEFQSHDIETVDEIFWLSEEMKAIVKKNVSPHYDLEEQVERLILLIFSQNNQGLVYRSNANLTAQQTFENKQANCISLTIMAYAMAKEAGLKVHFQDVKIPEYWVRNGQYSLLTGHVNMLVSENQINHTEFIFHPKELLIDFDPQIRKKNFPSRKMSKNNIVAMFYGNKAAQAMVDEEYSLAYAYLKSALTIYPDYAAAWGNLGILYKQLGHLDLAKQSYLYALQLEPRNLTTLTNLAILFKKQGHKQKAQDIRTKLHEQRLTNPYYHAMLADNALHAEQYASAIAYYKKAISLDNSQHEFYFGLARSYHGAGLDVSAQRAMKKAIKYNQFLDVQTQYVAKLNMLRSH